MRRAGGIWGRTGVWLLTFQFELSFGDPSGDVGKAVGYESEILGNGPGQRHKFKSYQMYIICIQVGPLGQKLCLIVC